MIVFDDADIEQTVRGIIASKYRNASQTCVCANRIFVQEKIYAAFMKKHKKAVASLKVREGTKPGGQIGPLIDEDAIKKVTRLIKDAEKKAKYGIEEYLESNTFSWADCSLYLYLSQITLTKTASW